MRIKRIITLAIIKPVLFFLAASALLSNPPVVYGAVSNLKRLNQLCGTSYITGQILTREEFTRCVAIAFIPISGNYPEPPFEDISQIKPENIRYISALYEAGVLSGSLGDENRLYMLPDEPITRQEAFTFLGRVAGGVSDFPLPFTDADTVAPWALSHIAWFAQQRIILGHQDGRLGPKERMTAEQLASFLLRTLDFLSEPIVSDLAGSGIRGFLDGSLREASFTLPWGVAASDFGIVVFDAYNNALREIRNGTVSVMAGEWGGLDDHRLSQGHYYDGGLNRVFFNRPTGGVYNPSGELLIADSGNHVIRIISEGAAYTFSGSYRGHADGPENIAAFNGLAAMAIDNSGNIYIADSLNHCVRKIDIHGSATTIAGLPGVAGFSDGAADKALFLEPAGIAVSEDGAVIYIADTGNHRIRKIENNQVSTITGYTTETDGEGFPLAGHSENGASSLNLPRGLAYADGVLFIADSGHNRIMAISRSGGLMAIAGTGEPGDIVGPAYLTQFHQPKGVSFHRGILYIADTLNNKIKTIPIDLESPLYN